MTPGHARDKVSGSWMAFECVQKKLLYMVHTGLISPQLDRYMHEKSVIFVTRFKKQNKKPTNKTKKTHTHKQTIPQWS